MEDKEIIKEKTTIEKETEILKESSKKIKSTIKKSTKSKKEICSVLWVKPNKIAFDFKGCGVSEFTESDFTGSKTIEVEYTGEIGKPNFNIISIKQSTTTKLTK